MGLIFSLASRLLPRSLYGSAVLQHLFSTIISSLLSEALLLLYGMSEGYASPVSETGSWSSADSDPLLFAPASSRTSPVSFVPGPNNDGLLPTPPQSAPGSPVREPFRERSSPRSSLNVDDGYVFGNGQAISGSSTLPRSAIRSQPNVLTCPRRRPALKTFDSGNSTSTGSIRSPDRFLPARRDSDYLAQLFHANKDPSKLTLSERLTRHESASLDVFGPRRVVSTPASAPAATQAARDRTVIDRGGCVAMTMAQAGC